MVGDLGYKTGVDAPGDRTLVEHFLERGHRWHPGDGDVPAISSQTLRDQGENDRETTQHRGPWIVVNIPLESLQQGFDRSIG